MMTSIVFRNGRLHHSWCHHQTCTDKMHPTWNTFKEHTLTLPKLLQLFSVHIFCAVFTTEEKKHGALNVSCEVALVVSTDHMPWSCMYGMSSKVLGIECKRCLARERFFLELLEHWGIGAYPWWTWCWERQLLIVVCQSWLGCSICNVAEGGDEWGWTLASFSDQLHAFVRDFSYLYVRVLVLLHQEQLMRPFTWGGPLVWKKVCMQEPWETLPSYASQEQRRDWQWWLIHIFEWGLKFGLEIHVENKMATKRQYCTSSL
jgi:hypothetical protein